MQSVGESLASGAFFGDYTGLAAYGGRVYGVWTEKPGGQPVREKDSQGHSRRQGTVVKVGGCGVRSG